MKNIKIYPQQLRNRFALPLIILISIALTGCTTTILDKHNAGMKATPGRIHYATAVPFGAYPHQGSHPTKDAAYKAACIHYQSYPSYQRKAEWPYDWFSGAGGDSQEGVESYAIKECEAQYNRTCIVILYNNVERCAATFESAYAREQIRVKQRQERIAQAAEEQQRAKAEREKRDLAASQASRENTCKSFGFKPGTEFFSSCLFEIYKIEQQARQNEALIAERKAQNRNQEAAQLEALSLQRQMLEDQRFSEGIQQMQDAAKILNPPRTTTRCKWNAITKTMTCD